MKKIIILEKEYNPNEIIFNYLLWVDVPTARQPFYADANATSAYNSATVGEIDLLKNGSVFEIRRDAVFSKTDTTADIKAFLIVKYNEAQDMINNINEWVYYGTYWDGSGWTNQGVA